MSLTVDIHVPYFRHTCPVHSDLHIVMKVEQLPISSAWGGGGGDAVVSMYIVKTLYTITTKKASDQNPTNPSKFFLQLQDNIVNLN